MPYLTQLLEEPDLLTLDGSPHPRGRTPHCAADNTHLQPSPCRVVEYSALGA